MTETKDIKKFIESDLLKKITRELSYKKFSIVGEADLQSIAYVYLKKYLSADTRYKIYNKIYLTQSGKHKGIYPDMAILRYMAQPRIALEFKENRILNDNLIIRDMKKLYEIPGISRGYLIYLTRDRKQNSDMLTGYARKVGEKYKKKIKPFVINAFEKIPESERDKWEQKWEKYSKFRIKKSK